MEDLHRFELVANPSLSPDGTRVVFEQTVVDVKGDGYITQLMLANADGSNLRPLTTLGKHNGGAAWSPDGRHIAFVSDRAFQSQVWVLPTDGGEARRVTRLQHGVSSLCWSPDGTTLYGLTAVDRGGTVAVYEPDLSEEEAEKQAKEAADKWRDEPKRYDRLRYKLDGAGLSKHRFQQLIAIDVQTGDVRQLTDGPYDVHAPAVSPDGQYIAFLSNRRADPDIEWWVADVYRVAAAGGALTLLAKDLSGNALSYSPDGTKLAVFGNGPALFEYWSAAHNHLFVLPSDGGEAVWVTRDFPDTLGDTTLTDLRANAREMPPVWSPDSRAVFAQSSREGACEVVRFAADGTGDADIIIGGSRDIYGFDTVDGQRFVIAYATSTHPGQIAAVDTSGVPARKRIPRAVTEPMTETRTAFFPEREQRLDAANAFLDEVALVEPEPFWYTSQDDWRVQGWVMKPANYEAGRKYPVVLEIHGGPQLNYGCAPFHEMQWIAAQGYAVVFTNPRGGMSYGQAFVNAVRHHYGEGDAADVLNGLDAALAQFDFLDETRVAVTGGSYGGFMTNWLVGHTDRFFAAVSQRSISNWVSFYGASDVGPLFCEAQHGTTPFDDMDELWQRSPLAYVKNVKTPLLLIHSENDLRCPMEQAEQFYTAIKRLGGEVALLRIPNASHGLSRNGKPKLRAARLNAIFEFIHEHLPQTK
ncbi:S9 family peptidase [Alicyclobacillus cycloheptanicus]|uniref:Acylaminoacyl-peptidase n=1 Tax=Alicyclobacillus cycloheptanicus TaxID=1457 RepID=A0ABT9XEQ6_9BACL|nr:S9 family peptidase [Alicyclobacillus cycloheptanicus]MDQ0188767.1 acylaminoacyl-peptidase [Alicyclobacillus cycloheptanicus]WDM00575.1 S9 family peptidase [Alicyclobacillus cycloheptanicus]